MMAGYTRSGRPALEQSFKDPGHWHIEGWCATRKDRKISSRDMWKATNGLCQYLELEQIGARWIYATTIEAMRDRIRDELFDG